MSYLQTTLLLALGLSLLGCQSQPSHSQPTPQNRERLTAQNARLLELDSSQVARQLAGGQHWKTNFAKIVVDPNSIRSGGPPKDGIPSIDNPRFVAPQQAESWLGPREPVLVVEHGNQAKAYPLGILIWHEIVNDRISGLPIVATYCPLCNTALVFQRNVKDLTLTFGTSGRLRHSDLIMYDRETGSWWQQATGRAIVGDFAGTELPFLPANTLGFQEARQLYDNLKVLSRDTGHSRDYGQNPYRNYDRSGPIPGLASQVDTRGVDKMTRVTTLDIGVGWAITFDHLRKNRVVNLETQEGPVVVFWKPGARSAVDATKIQESREVGQSAVFSRLLQGDTLKFVWEEGVFRDQQTGSSWDLSGKAIRGARKGQRLEPIAHGDHFWFAWASFRPETKLKR